MHICTLIHLHSFTHAILCSYRLDNRAIVVKKAGEKGGGGPPHPGARGGPPMNAMPPPPGNLTVMSIGQ